jgi:hypothetical protein
VVNKSARPNSVDVTLGAGADTCSTGRDTLQRCPERRRGLEGIAATLDNLGKAIRRLGDTYRYSLRDQYIDVTGLGPGRYRLLATADFNNWFLESDETNNATWVDIQLRGKGNSIKILGYGP